MRLRTWPFLLFGFGALLALISLSTVALERRTDKVRADVRAILKASEESGRTFQQLRSEIYPFAILVRDYLLESSAEPAAAQRQTLETLRRLAQDHVRALGERRDLHDHPKMQRLSAAIEDYLQSVELVFRWTPAQKASQGAVFLRHRVAPYRQIVFQLAAEVEDVNRSETLRRQEQVMQTQDDLKLYLNRVAAATLLLGLVVAGVSILRTRSLEASAGLHLHEIERSAGDLRRLSLKLSQAQEDERKSISRELHDQVGQMLTALRMELANIEEFRLDCDEKFVRHMVEARRLIEETVRTVRDISMGLRPAILDELGLGPALKWQAREFSRRSGVPADVQIDGELDKLSDAHRTCIYRVVQEALTNCARHAKAASVRITLHGSPGAVRLAVEDDGVGFMVREARPRGLGLLGMEERVRELGGKTEIRSQPAKGATVGCEIPTSRVSTE